MELTESQKLALETVQECGSVIGAAKKLGKDERAFKRLIARARKAQARQGYSPEHDMVKTCPDGYMVSGVSTLYTQGEDGTKVAAQWVKTRADQQRQYEIMREAHETLSEIIKRPKPLKIKQHGNEDLLNCYVITDYHLGMRCWPEETGGDWDTQIAENFLYQWFYEAFERAPKARHGLLLQLGDWLHFDGLDAVTPQSGHLLDADTRFQKLVRVTLRVFTHIISEMLERHETVHVIMAEGNHDLSASAWMREMFSKYYENEPRVTVDASPDPYYCYEFGQNSIFAHHGHKRKLSDIDRVFTSKFRQVFGRTRYSHAHLGHFHHQEQKENQLMLVEQHRTLAAADSYASRGGWIAGRSAKVITYHKEHGKVSEVQISPSMIESGE